MKLLMLWALLCVVALTRAAEKGADEHVQQPGKDVPQLEKRALWWCPTGWTQYGGRCFQFVRRLLTWVQAEKNCRAMGGHLASVRSWNEYYWLRRMIITQAHTTQQTWIGGSRGKTDATWFWSDGASFTFTYWCRGQPNSPGTQHCLEMNFSANKCWNDYQCYTRQASVCAKASILLG